jgi:hypothetical protein
MTIKGKFKISAQNLERLKLFFNACTSSWKRIPVIRTRGPNIFN